MSSQREPTPASSAQANPAKVSVGQFAERFRGEAIPLSNTFAYFCASVPMSEEVVKEYLEEPIGRPMASNPGPLRSVSKTRRS